MQEPNQIVIRPYEDRDLDPLVERVRDLQAAERSVEPLMRDPAEIGPWYVHSLLRDCEKYDGTILIAVSADEIVGYACVHTKVPCEADDEADYTYALLSDLSVAPSMRGHGIGHRLIEECKALTEAAGTRWFRIGVLAANEGALKLYLACGFKPRSIELEMTLEGKTPP